MQKFNKYSFFLFSTLHKHFFLIDYKKSTFTKLADWFPSIIDTMLILDIDEVGFRTNNTKLHQTSHTSYVSRLN